MRPRTRALVILSVAAVLAALMSVANPDRIRTILTVVRPAAGVWLWFILPLLGFLWAGIWWERREKRRVWPVRPCRGCGYELAGLKDGVNCPECGRRS